MTVVMVTQPRPWCTGLVRVPRLSREARTVGAMVRIFCRGRHGRREGLCPECAELLAYALERLDRCPFGPGKPTCARCPVHCYRPAQRERVREVMRHAGPKIVFRHPILAALHLLLDSRREAPGRPSRRKS